MAQIQLQLQLIDIRTRKLADGQVEAIAISDQVDEAGDPVVLHGHGATPELATADVERQAREWAGQAT